MVLDSQFSVDSNAAKPPVQSASLPGPSLKMEMQIKYVQLEQRTKPGIALHSISEDINRIIQAEGVSEGWVHVLSRVRTWYQ